MRLIALPAVAAVFAVSCSGPVGPSPAPPPSADGGGPPAADGPRPAPAADAPPAPAPPPDRPAPPAPDLGRADGAAPPPPADAAPPADLAPPPARDMAGGGGDRPPPTTIPDVPGCGTGSACSVVWALYPEAILRAKRCTAGAANPCAAKALGSLGCNGCPTWVNDLTEVGPMLQKWEQHRCHFCFYNGAPGENRCHPFGCNTLDFPMCIAAGPGAGTCANRERDRTCGPQHRNGAPCMPPGDDYCIGGTQSICSCDRNTMRWSCT